MTAETPTVPRVLLVAADSIDGISGTAITLTGLYGAWPPDALAQIIVTAPLAGRPPTHETYVVPSSAVPLDHYPRSALARLHAMRSGASARPQFIESAADGTRRRSTSRSLHRHARAAADLSPVVVPREMREWIASFAPDVVYSLLGSVRMMRLARLVGTVADAPVIPHFMDDWPSTLYSQGELAGAARRTALRELDAIVRRAPAALTISTAMADEYATRFGRSFEVFGNPVDVLPAPPRLTAAGSPLTLLYIGGLHLERWKTIRDIGQSLDARDARARPWKVRVHAPAKDVARYGQAFSGICSVEIAETLAPIDVPSALASGDVLLHVESFDPVITRHTRLSLSTKLPQYLAAGRPVLAIGPGANASISLIERTGAGIVAEDPSMRGLGQALARLEDQRTRTEMARRGVVVANRDYSRTAVRNRLREVLTQASGSR